MGVQASCNDDQNALFVASESLWAYDYPLGLDETCKMATEHFLQFDSICRSGKVLSQNSTAVSCYEGEYAGTKLVNEEFHTFFCDGKRKFERTNTSSPSYILYSEGKDCAFAVEQFKNSMEGAHPSYNRSARIVCQL